MSQITSIAPKGGSGGINTIQAGDNISAVVTSPGTVLISVNGTNNHSILLGNDAGSINSLGVGATGSILVGNNSANPSFSVTPSINGTMTAHSFFFPNTTADFASGFIAQNGIPIIHNYTNNPTVDQIFIGQAAGNASAADNTGSGCVVVGTSAMEELTGGVSFCTVLGNYAYFGGTGSNATIIGYQASNTCNNSADSIIIGFSASFGTSSQTNSVIIGSQAMVNASGDCTGNVILGFTAGSSFATTESNNILINSAGLPGDQGTTRIGNAGTTQQCFISGISGVSDTSGTLTTVTGISSTDQLTTVTLLGSDSLAITPASGSLTFTATGTLPSLTIGNATIDSTGVFSSSAQPSIQANQSTDQANATGNGTVFTVICDNVLAQNGTNYNSTTGAFTVPSSGFYMVTVQVMIKNLSNLMTSGILTINGSLAPHITYFNPFAMIDVITSFVTINVAAVLFVNATNPLSFTVEIDGGSGNTATIAGSGSDSLTSFGVVKLN